MTTYAAVFNGLARRFREAAPTGYIFDDAHTAEHIIRGAYTLTLNMASHGEAVRQLFALFRTYFAAIQRVVSYDELSRGQDTQAFEFVPPFVIKNNLEEFRRILVEADLGNCTDSKFAWAHLREHIHLCAVFVSNETFHITPPFLPIRQHYAMIETARRIYLSATLNVEDAFLRTFGRRPTIIRASQSSAGECERMILVPHLFKDHPNDIEAAKSIVANYKTLVSVPTFRRAQDWSDIADVAEEEVKAKIEAFKTATDNRKLSLVSRYDGVDLPDDACRVMVIDDLPSSSSLLERFMFERLGLLKGLRSTIASRIVQCFGRISRGTRDHGVFIITGDRLLAWLQTASNEQSLAPFLRKQWRIGTALSRSVSDSAAARSLVEQCLDRTRSDKWTTFYTTKLEQQQIDDVTDTDAGLVENARLEVEFGELLWSRRYGDASEFLANHLDEAFSVSRKSGAWYALWLGYSFDLQGDAAAAMRFYSMAASAAVNVLLAPQSDVAPESARLPTQVQNIDAALNYVDNRSKMQSILTRMNTELSALKGGSPTAVTLALQSLGRYLGLSSSRPDDEGEEGGPDVCWYLEGDLAFCMEAKTDKQLTSCYRKDELGQVDDHRRWAGTHLNASVVSTVFVGPVLAACDRTNPADEFSVVGLAAFDELGRRLIAAIEDVSDRRSPLMFASDIHRVFGERGLLYPACVNALERHPIRLA